MPNSVEHRAKYTANRNHLNTGNGGSPLSTVDGCWAAIVAFYAALHLVDRLAAILNFHPQRPGAHRKRLQFVSANHPTILPEYKELKTASEIARYGPLNQFNRADPGNVVQTVLIDQYLTTIEKYVDAVFNPPSAPGIGPTAAGS
jgi:hypothetical protein